MLRKNETVPLSVTGITSGGYGVGRAPDGMVVFVPFTAEGDEILARITRVGRDYAYGETERVLCPSPDRAEPDCPAFPACGGCAFRHLRYSAECRVKERFLTDAFSRVAGLTVAPEPFLSGVPFGYRNKAQYPFFTGKTGVNVGFYAARTHRAVAGGFCLLQPPEFGEIARLVCETANALGLSVYDETTGRGLLRHLFLRKAESTGELMVVFVLNGETLPGAKRLIGALTGRFGSRIASVQINLNRADTNVVLGRECRVLYGRGYLTDTLCGKRVRVGPHTFYQVNRKMAEAVYRKAAEYARPAGKTVLDLYCGAGTVGLSMADTAARVVGVESVPQAVADARVNAKANGAGNMEFLCADAEAAAETLARRGLRPDVAVADPPRKGCSEKTLRVLAERLAPERVVYLSCDPATLARDCGLLGTLGYRVTRVTGADLFPRTRHVESAVLLERGQKEAAR